MENVIPKDQLEQYVAQIIKEQWKQVFIKECLEPLIFSIMRDRFPKLFEELVKGIELREKEIAIMERALRVEEELKQMRLMSQQNFEIWKKQFELSDRRFELCNIK